MRHWPLDRARQQVRSARAFLVLLAVICVSCQTAATQQPLNFVDVADEVGLDISHSAFHWDVSMDPVAMMGGGLCWVDIDADGWLDLFMTDTWSNGEWGRWDAGGTGALPTTRLFRNQQGVFEEVTTEWGAGFAVRANGCAAGDFDSDGYTDIYVTTERGNLLLWNEAGERFVEGAEEAGVQGYGWSTGIAVGDIDGDGYPDLVIAGYADLNRAVTDAQTGFPNTFEPIADLVYQNRGAKDPRVFDSVDAGLEPGGFEYGLGVVLADFDGDADLDLYVANDTQPNRLYRNDSVPGLAQFVDISATSGADDPNSGMGVAIADTDGDLLTDLVVTNLQGQGHATLRQSPDGDFLPTFDAVYQVGMVSTGWGTSFGDFDNDGDADIIVASGAIPITSLSGSAQELRYLRNNAGEFVADEVAVGLDQLPLLNGRAVAVADYDNDGDLDVAVSAIGQPLVLLQNQVAGTDWLQVAPLVPTAGLRVRVELASGEIMERIHHVGGSWLSSEDPRVHFGIPRDDPIQQVEVWAPDGSRLYLGTPDTNEVLELEA